jgi:hypothetical protein
MSKALSFLAGFGTGFIQQQERSKRQAKEDEERDLRMQEGKIRVDNLKQDANDKQAIRDAGAQRSAQTGTAVTGSNGEVAHQSSQTAQPAGKANAQEWYVLKWDNRYGPFSYLDVIKMLQEKNIFEFDFVWRQGFDGWHRIAELSDFSSETIKSLSSSSSKKSEDVFYRRRHARTKHNASIIVHDGNNVWKGTSLEISEGGAGLVMHNALVLPGQKVYLHFKPGDGVPPFNAVCEIVSKQYVKGVKSKEAPIGYGVKFLEVSGDVQKVIRKLASKTAA